MNQLLPIVRRARRALLPPDDLVVAMPAEVVEPSPTVPLVEASRETATLAPVDPLSVAVSVIQPVELAAPVPPAAKGKRKRRGENAPI